jgi:hypothetical protein
MTKDDKEEDELNNAPLPNLLLSLLVSLLLLPRSLFSCPTLSALPEIVAVVSLFLRGLPLPASPRAAAQAPSLPSAHPGGGLGGMAPHLGGNGAGGPLRPPPLPPATRPPSLGLGIQDSCPGGTPLRWPSPAARSCER